MFLYPELIRQRSRDDTSPEGVDETKDRAESGVSAVTWPTSPQTGDVVIQLQPVTTAGPEEVLQDRVPLWGIKPGPRSQNQLDSG